MDDEITFGRVVKWGLLGVVFVGVIGVAGSFMITASSVVTAPGRVVSKTLETDNIINNYEWYHDAYAQYRSRVGQINDFQKLASAADGREKDRLNIELGAVKQSCRDLATKYNANSIKSNRAIFKGREAPESLSMEACQ